MSENASGISPCKPMRRHISRQGVTEGETPKATVSIAHSAFAPNLGYLIKGRPTWITWLACSKKWNRIEPLLIVDSDLVSTFCMMSFLVSSPSDQLIYSYFFLLLRALKSNFNRHPRRDFSCRSQKNNSLILPFSMTLVAAHFWLVFVCFGAENRTNNLWHQKWDRASLPTLFSSTFIPFLSLDPLSYQSGHYGMFFPTQICISSGDFKRKNSRFWLFIHISFVGFIPWIFHFRLSQESINYLPLCSCQYQ